MLLFILGFIIGSIATFIAILGYCIFQYYSAMHQAHKEGWEIPN